jgi:hypothetical protein
MKNGYSMAVYDKLFIGGDSATDEIIVDNVKLNDTHVFDERIHVYTMDASARQLNNIFYYYNNDELPKPVNASSKTGISEESQSDKPTGQMIDPGEYLEAKYTTLSKWTKKIIDKKTKLVFNEFIGAKPLGKSNSSKDPKEIIKFMLDKEIAVIFDVYYDSEYDYYRDLADKFDGWIVVRTLPEKNEVMSKFMQMLIDKKIKKTIVILNSNDLRKGGYKNKISEGISWEQLITETYDALSCSKWSEFGYLVICFEHEGIMLFDNKNKKCTALFYPNEIEGDYLRSRSKVFGQLITFQAVLAIYLCMNSDKLREDANIMSILTEASKIGIGAMRELLECGFSVDETKVLYPYKEICSYIKDSIAGINKDNTNKIAILDLPYKKIVCNMTILEEKKQDENAINDLCENIIKKGVGHILLEGIPVLEYGDLILANRYDIEAYRRIYNLFEDYLSDHKIDKPLSICVFGAPGSGKSHGIKQMVKHFNKKTETQILTFNLSQFNLDDLSSAFDQVRDINLEGKLPVVIWDEFDCEVNGQPLGWLKRFLAPIQDGEYYENANKHLIGRAIFVFVGGVYRTSSEMKRDEVDNKDSKLPDFRGRIKENLNVRGLNQEKCGFMQFLEKKENNYEQEYCDEVNGELNAYKEYFQSSRTTETRCYKKLKENISASQIKKNKKLNDLLENLKHYCRMAQCEDSLYKIRRAVIIRKSIEKYRGMEKNEEMDEITSSRVIEKLLNRNEGYEHGIRTLESEIKKLFITNN